MQLLLVLTLLAVSTGLPVQDGAPQNENEDTFLQSQPLERTNRAAPGIFKYIYVGYDGRIDDKWNFGSTPLEVARSPLTSERGLHAAALFVAKVIKNMPKYIFTQLVKKGSVGVFTAKEKLTVFPEFADVANGNCGTSCAGACAKTCAPNGLKYEDCVGLADERGVALEDNVLCTKRDPLRSRVNVIIHEFAHVIHKYGLPLKLQQKIHAAYQKAKSKGIWDNTSYALSDVLEYFAESATCFLHVNKDNDQSGGMAYCDGKWCPSYKAARMHIYEKDPALLDILSHVFTNDRPAMDTNVTICPPSE